MDEIERNARLLKEHCKSPGWDDGSYSRLAQDIAAAGLTLAPIEPSDATLDEMASAILAKVPIGYGMTQSEAQKYARAAYRVGIGREDQ